MAYKLKESFYPSFGRCKYVTFDIIDSENGNGRPVLGETCSILDYYEVKRKYKEKMECLENKRKESQL